MKQKIPPIIQKVGFDFHWDNQKVWKLDIPVETLNISDLDWHFDIPFWSKRNGFYNLSPNEVLKNKETYKEEFERILKADLTHPLDIMFWKGKWLLLDGLHRLLKAKHLGQTTIKVRKIDKKFIPQIKK